MNNPKHCPKAANPSMTHKSRAAELERCLQLDLTDASTALGSLNPFERGLSEVEPCTRELNPRPTTSKLELLSSHPNFLKLSAGEWGF